MWCAVAGKWFVKIVETNATYSQITIPTYTNKLNGVVERHIMIVASLMSYLICSSKDPSLKKRKRHTRYCQMKIITLYTMLHALLNEVIGGQLLSTQPSIDVRKQKLC